MHPLAFVLLSGLLVGGSQPREHWHDDEGHLKKLVVHRNHDDRSDVDREYDHRAAECYFPPADLRVITEYYDERPRSLPPGLQRKLYRTGRLPPGWERRLEPLPVVVDRQLVPLPYGYRRGLLDGYVVVYNPQPEVIVDVVALFGWR